MMAAIVCPSCHGNLNKIEHSSDGPTTVNYECVACKEVFPSRDNQPVLIYPKADMKRFEVIYSGGSSKRRHSLFRRAYDLFSYQIKTSGLGSAIKMVPTFFWGKLYNKAIIIISRISPQKKVECSCCGWEGLKFGIFWGTHESYNNFSCPNCDSHPRHRVLSLYIPEWIDISSANILHFAPESYLSGLF